MSREQVNDSATRRNESFQDSRVQPKKKLTFS